MSNIKFTIKRQEEFTAADMGLNELSELGGCSDYGNSYGLGGWQYEFDVEVINQSNEKKQFTVVFQTESRTDGIRNYSGSEIATASHYGCDADESGELEVFCDYDNTVVEQLEVIAQKAADKELERLLNEKLD